MEPNQENGTETAPYFDQRRALRLSGALLILSICFLSACGLLSSGSAGTNDSASPEPSAEASADAPENDENATTAGGACDNPYYPVDPSKVRKYKLDSKLPGGNREYTLRQRKVDEDTFSEERSFDSGIDVSVNWNCTPEGLRTAEYMSQAQMQAGTFQMETIESSGTTIPRDWELGKEWESRYKVKANLNAGPVKAAAEGNVILEHKLAAVDETVRVAGGEFKANRVDTVIRLDLSMKGTAIPSKEVRMSVWYAPDVGIVKQQVHGDYGDEKVEFAGMER